MMPDFRSKREIAWTGYVTIVRTEVRRFMRIKSQSLVPPVITMALYLYIFGSIIGRKVGTLLDMPYVQFIGPGIIAMALINNAYSNVSSSFFSAKNHCVYEEMFVTPIPTISIILGYLSGGVCRGLIVMCLVSVVVYLFNPFTIHNIFVVTCVAFTTAVIFSALGMINAIIADNHDEANWVNNFVITPLTYMGGVFFPMTSLPAMLQPIAELNPILMVVSSFRYGILGVEAGSVVIHLLGLLICTIALVILLAVMIERRYRLSD